MMYNPAIVCTDHPTNYKRIGTYTLSKHKSYQQIYGYCDCCKTESNLAFVENKFLVCRKCNTKYKQ